MPLDYVHSHEYSLGMDKTNTMSHAEMMADRSGIAHLWVADTFAKIVVDGRSIARADKLTDGTVRLTRGGLAMTSIVHSWQEASAWITAQAAAIFVETGSLTTLAHPTKTERWMSEHSGSVPAVPA